MHDDSCSCFFLAAVAPPPAVSCEPHALDEAKSPLIRALPDYERQFRYHLAQAGALFEASQVSMHVSS